MARVTIEDCLAVVPDRFKLIEIAASRSRSISEDGAVLLVERENDRDTIVALREIALGHTSFSNNHLFDDVEIEDSVESSSEATELINETVEVGPDSTEE